MQELTAGIEQEIKKGGGESNHPLRQTAIAWAAHCLVTYDGELLKKALIISAGIADFLNELEQKF